MECCFGARPPGGTPPACLPLTLRFFRAVIGVALGAFVLGALANLGWQGWQKLGAEDAQPAATGPAAA